MFTIRSQTAFHGPNIWDRSPVTHLVVEMDAALGASFEVADLVKRYAALAEIVHEGTTLEPCSIATGSGRAATLALVALNLQRIAGVAVDFSFGRPRSGEDSHDVVVQHRHPVVGIVAARLAIRWLAHLTDSSGVEFDLIEEFRRFTMVVASNDHGVSGRAIANAATRRGIPQTVVDPRGRVVEFGDGRYRKRMFGASTSLTSSIGAWMSRDKHLTNQYLREAGVPAPESIVARSLHEVLTAARTIGFPVAIKPLDLGASIGVLLDLRDEDDIRARFETVADAVAKSTGRIVVERFVPGNDYRALVVNGTVVGVSHRIRPQVIGDGASTIQQLIESENTHPRRGIRTSDVYKKIVIDDLVEQNIARLGMTLDDVPPMGQRIELKLSGSRHDGALCIDVTDDIHPANAALLVTAAMVIGLDIAGIDLIAPDIAQPFGETGGVILEVNDSPGFSLHLFPAAGPVRDPGPAIMEMLFPPGQPVRVPVVAVMANVNSAAIGRSVANIVAASGQAVGLATTDGLLVDGLSYHGVDPRNPAGPRTLLNNPTVEAAVVEVDAESILAHGLGFDVCDVAIIFTLSGLETPYGQPVETVLLSALDADGTAILNGADPAVCALADRCPGTVVLAETAEAAVSAAIARLARPSGH